MPNRSGRLAERSYCEVAPAADLAGVVRCIWFRRVGQSEAERPVRVLPDGCMDLIWRDDGRRGELFVAGPDTAAQVSRSPAGTEFTALRFKPGAAPAVLGVPASELVDARPEAGALWGRAATELTCRLERAGSAAVAAAILEGTVRDRLVAASAPDPIVQQVVASLEGGPRRAHAVIGRLAGTIGISERQLHRRCLAALGYGPRTFAGIVRFQRFLERAGDPVRRSLAVLAAESGYADQSHLNREVQRLAGLTPARLLAEHAA